MVLVLHYNDTFFICHTHNYGCQIYTLWWPNYICNICNIYIYIYIYIKNNFMVLTITVGYTMKNRNLTK